MFFGCFIFYCHYYIKYFVMSANQIVISTSIINYLIIDLALNQKKNHTDDTLVQVFLLYWVRNLQKLTNLRKWGALLRIWRPSKTEECDMCPLNLWHLAWNTPGSPQTARRDIWRLAIETLSILSLHIFLNRIRSQIESPIENRKSRMDRTEN